MIKNLEIELLLNFNTKTNNWPFYYTIFFSINHPTYTNIKFEILIRKNVEEIKNNLMKIVKS